MKSLRFSFFLVLCLLMLVPVAAGAQQAAMQEDSPLAKQGAVVPKPAALGEERTRPAGVTRAKTAVAEAVPVSHLAFRSMGEYVGGGATRLLSTTNDDDFTWQVVGNEIRLRVWTATGTWWDLDLAGPVGRRIEAGEYLRASRWPFHADTANGLDFSGDGRGCNTLAGHFKVQEAGYREDGQLQVFRATFRQHCEEGALPLLGEVRLGIEEVPPIPDPVPLDPASLIMVSEPGDWVGAGQTWIHSSSSGSDVFGWRGNSGFVGVGVGTAVGSGWWNLEFEAPAGRDLTPGRFLNAKRYPFNASTVPGLSVSGQGRGCNQLTGEFTIYEAVWGPDENYANRLLRFDASFVQHCDGGPALTGEIQLGTPDPLHVLTQVAGRATVGRSGSAMITGRLTCTINGTATISGAVAQSQGQAVLSKTFSATVPCTRQTSTWRVEVAPDAGAFRPGAAAVSGVNLAHDVYGQDDEQPFLAAVRMVPRARR